MAGVRAGTTALGVVGDDHHLGRTIEGDLELIQHISANNGVYQPRGGENLNLNRVEVADLEDDQVRREDLGTAVETANEFLIHLEQTEIGDQSFRENRLVCTCIHQSGYVLQPLPRDRVGQVQEYGRSRRVGG
jgi:hypothetical protein